MKKILLLTDFSEASHTALRYIRSFLSDTVADIHLLGVYPMKTESTREPDNTEKSARSAFFDQLQTIITGLRQEATNDWHTFRATARVGTLLDVVQEMVRVETYDYVVVGIGKDADNPLFSTSATALATQLQTNVMTVPVDASPDPIRHVVLATDFANLNDCKLLLPVKKLVTLKGAMLTLLTVDVPGKDVILPQQELRIRRFLRPIAPSVAHVQANKPKPGISQFVKNHRVDLMVTVPPPLNWQKNRTGAGLVQSPTLVLPIPTITLYNDGQSDRPKQIEQLSALDIAW